MQTRIIGACLAMHGPFSVSDCCLHNGGYCNSDIVSQCGDGLFLILVCVSTCVHMNEVRRSYLVIAFVCVLIFALVFGCVHTHIVL